MKSISFFTIEFLFSALVLLAILYPYFRFRKEFDRHISNVGKASRVIDKIGSFEFAGQKINYLRKIDPFVFEELLLSSFEMKGFKVVRNKRYTGDAGIDGTIYDKRGNKIWTQAKRYRGYIDPKHITAFEDLLLKGNISVGYFIHTGKSSVGTRTRFRNSRVRVIGGSSLIRLLENPC